MDRDRRLTRLRHKQVTELPRLHALLDESLWGHVAYADERGEPQILPVAIARHGDDLVWHGSTGSTWLRLVGERRTVAVSVSSVEALVVGRTRFEHSLWYRSAVVYGIPRRLAGAELDRALDALTDHVLPGRVAETRASTDRELAATLVLAMPITDWVLKESREWPDDPEPDRRTDVWAGIVPLRQAWSAPVPAPDLTESVPVPPSCRRLVKGDR